MQDKPALARAVLIRVSQFKNQKGNGDSVEETPERGEY
jgi:hypothetical protein